MKNIDVEELKNWLEIEDLTDLKEEILKLEEELNCDALTIASLLAKKVEKGSFYQKKDKIVFIKNPNAQRFFINIGHCEQLDENGLMEFIIEHIPNVTKNDFSDVYIRDRYSFFELPEERRDDVLNNINGLTYKDRAVRVELSEKRERLTTDKKQNRKNRFHY